MDVDEERVDEQARHGRRARLGRAVDGEGDQAEGGEARQDVLGLVRRGDHGPPPCRTRRHQSVERAVAASAEDSSAAQDGRFEERHRDRCGGERGDEAEQGPGGGQSARGEQIQGQLPGGGDDFLGPCSDDVVGEELAEAGLQGVGVGGEGETPSSAARVEAR
ncbi:hypothetical protein [Streptomyces alboflavus]|uniref:hypothetical protein n=1 Tax=Streptomyces alboflavus TaxID=67267 RepID=UPI001331B9C8|nr:hypothetical protein [Streptomyces alboflavus]